MKTVVVWFRNNLRVEDQPLLSFDQTLGTQVLALFVIDLRWFRPYYMGMQSMGAHRYRFLYESLIDLRKELNQQGLPLLLKFGKPESIVPEVCEEFQATELRYQREPGYYESKIERTIDLAVIQRGIRINDYSISTLVDASLVVNQLAQLPVHFTVFRERLEKDWSVPSCISPIIRIKGVKLSDQGRIPSAVEFGLEEVYPDHRADVIFKGGESQALLHLQDYLESGALSTYFETRNQLQGESFASHLSPWLAIGNLSPRTIYFAVKQYESQFGANKSTYWLIFELLWRDFFKFNMLKYGALYFHKRGIKRQIHKGTFDHDLFYSWKHGQTPNELVNAAMIELNCIGFLSNRMRQVVASYLVNDLKQDWRYGAAWFEHQLIDFDVSSNYGNWAYIAGVGNDPRSHRYFDVEKQANLFDPDYTYRHTWLVTN